MNEPDDDDQVVVKSSADESSPRNLENLES